MSASPTNSEELMARLVESTREAAYEYIVDSVSQVAQAAISEDTHALIIGAATLLGFEEDLSQNLVVHATSSPIEDVEAEAKVQSGRLARSIVSTWFEHILMASEAGHQDIVLDKHFCLTGMHRADFLDDLRLAGSRYDLGESGTIAILTAGCSHFLADAGEVRLPDELYLRRVGDAYSVLSEARLKSFDDYLKHFSIRQKIKELSPVVLESLTLARSGRLSTASLIPSKIEASISPENDRLLSTCTYVQAQDFFIPGASTVTGKGLEIHVVKVMEQCARTSGALSAVDAGALHVTVHQEKHGVS